MLSSGTGQGSAGERMGSGSWPRLDSPNPCPVITLQHDGIDIPDQHSEENGCQPSILVTETEPYHYGQAYNKTAQVHEFVVPRARFPFDRRIEIFYLPEARIGTPSSFIPVIATCGEAFEPTDAQSFVEPTITFKAPQIETGQVSHLFNLPLRLARRRPPLSLI
jgi:hypothetical protein